MPKMSAKFDRGQPLRGGGRQMQVVLSTSKVSLWITHTTVERVVAECTSLLYVGLLNPLTPLLRFVQDLSYKL